MIVGSPDWGRCTKWAQTSCGRAYAQCTIFPVSPDMDYNSYVIWKEVLVRNVSSEFGTLCFLYITESN